jgi:hypothetical protein
MANELLLQYPSDITEPAKVLLRKVRGEAVPLATAVHAGWHLQGVALGQLLPDNGGGMVATPKRPVVNNDPVSEAARKGASQLKHQPQQPAQPQDEEFDAGVTGDEEKTVGGIIDPDGGSPARTPKPAPVKATDDPDSGAPPMPPGFKTPGFKHCPPPAMCTNEECEHVLAQCCGERGMRGPLTDALISKLLSVVTKLLTDWITSRTGSLTP